jgi:hypothetical protein
MLLQSQIRCMSLVDVMELEELLLNEIMTSDKHSVLVDFLGSKVSRAINLYNF